MTLGDTDTWLENNYRNNNGLPSFFVQGRYGFSNRAIAMQDFKDCVSRAINSKHHAYSLWAKSIIENNFCVSIIIYKSIFVMF